MGFDQMAKNETSGMREISVATGSIVACNAALGTQDFGMMPASFSEVRRLV